MQLMNLCGENFENKRAELMLICVPSHEPCRCLGENV